jgi:hypothetical protein
MSLMNMYHTSIKGSNRHLTGDMNRLSDAQILARYAQIHEKENSDATTRIMFTAVDNLQTQVVEDIVRGPLSQTPAIETLFDTTLNMLDSMGTEAHPTTHRELKEELINYVRWLYAVYKGSEAKSMEPAGPTRAMVGDPRGANEMLRAPPMMAHGLEFVSPESAMTNVIGTAPRITRQNVAIIRRKFTDYNQRLTKINGVPAQGGKAEVKGQLRLALILQREASASFDTARGVAVATPLTAEGVGQLRVIQRARDNLLMRNQRVRELAAERERVTAYIQQTGPLLAAYLLAHPTGGTRRSSRRKPRRKPRRMSRRQKTRRTNH